MHERSRLQSMAGPLLSQVLSSYAAQLSVDQRQKAVQRACVAVGILMHQHRNRSRRYQESVYTCASVDEQSLFLSFHVVKRQVWSVKHEGCKAKYTTEIWTTYSKAEPTMEINARPHAETSNTLSQSLKESRVVVARLAVS
jgi:hypothetical protein